MYIYYTCMCIMSVANLDYSTLANPSAKTSYAALSFDHTEPVQPKNPCTLLSFTAAVSAFPLTNPPSSLWQPA